MFESLIKLQQDVALVIDQVDNKTIIKDQKLLQERLVDKLLMTSVFSEDESLRKESRSSIRKLAAAMGAISSSIHDFYSAIGHGKFENHFTVPAFNLRTLTYDTARIVFRIAKEQNIGPFVFEIARSEMDYTLQRPDEYTVSILAAAIKEGWNHPVFLQGDHIQFSARRFNANPEEEKSKIKSLIKECIDGGFYNIDIDASTLVDLGKPSINEQQKNNYEVTAEMTKYIRRMEPDGVSISIGAEIGHIGGVNSTPQDFEAFMLGYQPLIDTDEGITKISVQTGTSHGGVPLPDGTMAEIKLDFTVIQHIGDIAKNKYHIGGAVQHGASTLPNELFGEFPKYNTLEIHLATGFQNIVYDTLPNSLKNSMYEWIKTTLAGEREEGWSDEQFIYKSRKKALGTFKRQLWEMTEMDKQPIKDALEKEFRILFEKLNLKDTRTVVDQYVRHD